MSNRVKHVKMKIADLVLDFDLYPRHDVDSTHVGHLREALEAGHALPEPVADAKSKRLTDGMHTVYATKKMFGPDYEMTVTLVNYKNEKEMLLDAMRRNIIHGRRLSTWDRVRCISLAETMGISQSNLADALCLTRDRIAEIKRTRIVKIRGAQYSACLKRSVVPALSGRTITKAQAAAIKTLGGNHPSYYVHQLINLIENDMLDKGNERLMERLAYLHALLEDFVPAGRER